LLAIATSRGLELLVERQLSRGYRRGDGVDDVARLAVDLMCDSDRIAQHRRPARAASSRARRRDLRRGSVRRADSEASLALTARAGGHFRSPPLHGSPFTFCGAGCAAGAGAGESAGASFWSLEVGAGVVARAAGFFAHAAHSRIIAIPSALI
jgi:hypothetical protein